ncbi:MAG: hypothetical protein ACOCP4_06470 [Candidatus Woesearchaeota archaeon]
MIAEELRKYRVTEDKNLLLVEKESFFHISGVDYSKAMVTSNMKAIMEQLLAISEFNPRRYYTNDNNELIHLEGEVPISYIRLNKKGNPKRNYISTMVRN